MYIFPILALTIFIELLSVSSLCYYCNLHTLYKVSLLVILTGRLTIAFIVVIINILFIIKYYAKYTNICIYIKTFTNLLYRI